MLSEVLGISVPSSFDEKPNDYTSFEHHVQKVKTKKSRGTKVDNDPVSFRVLIMNISFVCSFLIYSLFFTDGNRCRKLKFVIMIK